MAEYSLNSYCRRFPGSAQGGRYLLNFDSVADRAILQALLVHDTTLAPELAKHTAGNLRRHVQLQKHETSQLQALGACQEKTRAGNVDCLSGNLEVRTVHLETSEAYRNLQRITEFHAFFGADHGLLRSRGGGCPRGWVCGEMRTNFMPTFPQVKYGNTESTFSVSVFQTRLCSVPD